MNAETIKAVAGLVALVAVNVAAQVCNITLDLDTATSVCLAVLTAAVTAWAAWKDHDITPLAQMVKEVGNAAVEELTNGYAEDDESDD